MQAKVFARFAHDTRYERDTARYASDTREELEDASGKIPGHLFSISGEIIRFTSKKEILQPTKKKPGKDENQPDK